MAKKIRLTQEEEVIRLLQREGFKEITPAELATEPYKSLAVMPECFDETSTVKSASRKQKNSCKEAGVRIKG